MRPEAALAREWRHSGRRLQGDVGFGEGGPRRAGLLRQREARALGGARAAAVRAEEENVSRGGRTGGAGAGGPSLPPGQGGPGPPHSHPGWGGRTPHSHPGQGGPGPPHSHPGRGGPGRAHLQASPACATASCTEASALLQSSLLVTTPVTLGAPSLLPLLCRLC